LSVYGGHSDIIYSGNIDDRIEALKKSLPDYDGQHIVPDDFCNDDEREEYEALTQFRTDVTDMFGEKAWEDSPGFIAESYFDNYVNSDMEGMYGSEVINGLDRFLDWGAIKDEYMEKFEEIDFDGVTYLIDRSYDY
jgi:hypothetical protein